MDNIGGAILLGAGIAVLWLMLRPHTPPVQPRAVWTARGCEDGWRVQADTEYEAADRFVEHVLPPPTMHSVELW